MAKAISLREYIERVIEKYPQEKYEVVEYTRMSAPVGIKCLKCGQILKYPQARNFLVSNKKHGCSDCFGLRKIAKEKTAELEERYEIISKKDATNRIIYTCKCRKCGRVSSNTKSNFINSACRCEGKGVHWSEEEIKNSIFDKYGNEYTLLSSFTTVNQKVKIEHSCGFIWETTLAHFLYNKTRCPICARKQSKPCAFIEKYLETNKIAYEKERFLDNSLQRFDFYVENDKGKIAIEYNGEQHYKYNPWFHGNNYDTFKKYKERDVRKANYCAENGIRLIVIPYTYSYEEIENCLDNLFGGSTTIRQE